jgi:replication factor C subunit 3/5
LNASDERGVDIIRVQIQQFVKSSHLFEAGYKFVVLDEVDYMTKAAQQSLKILLQNSRATVRYCLICNYISKIDPLLQEEFMIFRFNQLPQPDIEAFLFKVCLKENISWSAATLRHLQLYYKSDIRSMLNYLQLHRDEERLMIDDRLWIEMESLLEQPCDRRTFLEWFQLQSNRYNVEHRYMIGLYLKGLARKMDFDLEFWESTEAIVHAPMETPVTVLLESFYFAYRKKKSFPKDGLFHK